MNVLQIKAAVRTRDGHCCTECGTTSDQHRARYGRTLEVHRLKPGSEYTVDGCVTLCKPCHGPKPRRARGTVPVVRVERSLKRLLTQLAVYHRVTIAELVDPILRPFATEEFRQMAKRVCKESEESA